MKCVDNCDMNNSRAHNLNHAISQITDECTTNVRRISFVVHHFDVHLTQYSIRKQYVRNQFIYKMTYNL